MSLHKQVKEKEQELTDTIQSALTEIADKVSEADDTLRGLVSSIDDTLQTVETFDEAKEALLALQERIRALAGELY